MKAFILLLLTPLVSSFFENRVHLVRRTAPGSSGTATPDYPEYELGLSDDYMQQILAAMHAEPIAENLQPKRFSDLDGDLSGPLIADLPETNAYMYTGDFEQLYPIHEGRVDINKFKERSGWDRYVSVPLDQNPLLMEPTPEQIAAIERLKKVNPGIRSEIWHENSGDTWTDRFWTAAKQLADVLQQSDSRISMTTVRDIIGPWRNHVKVSDILAKFETDPHAFVPKEFSEFGQPRSKMDKEAIATRVVGPYGMLLYAPGGESVLSRVEKILAADRFREELLTDNVAPSLVQLDHDFQLDTGLGWNALQFRYTLMVQTHERKVELVRYERRWNRVEDLALPAFVVLNTFEEPDIAAIFDRILARIRHASRDPQVSLSQYSKMVATMHWLIANTSPFYRGSAAMADLLTATFYLMKGYQWQGWADAISADVTALCTPHLPSFQNMFESLMFKPPKRLHSLRF